MVWILLVRLCDETYTCESAMHICRNKTNLIRFMLAEYKTDYEHSMRDSTCDEDRREIREMHRDKVQPLIEGKTIMIYTWPRRHFGYMIHLYEDRNFPFALENDNVVTINKVPFIDEYDVGLE